MLTKQEYLLSVPFEYILGFSLETGLIRDGSCFTKKDFVQRLMLNLKISECKQVFEDFKNGHSYKRSVEWFLAKLPTGEMVSKNFVETHFRGAANAGPFCFEFPILETRVDILRLSGSFHAYEVKSQRDKLDRLNYQVPALKRFFEYVSLVVSYDLAQKVVEKVDCDIGIITFRSIDNDLIFETYREGCLLDSYDPTCQLNLLQITELRSLYEKIFDSAPSKRKNRKELSAEIICHSERSEINEIFKSKIRNREKIQKRTFSESRDLSSYLR